MTLQLLTILTAAGGMALVALTHNAAAVYFMFSALLAVVLVSYVISRVSARALDWRREASDRVFENEPFNVHVELTNRGRLPRFLLTVRDTLPDFLETDGPTEFVLPALWPRERVTLSYPVRARKRGAYDLGPLSVSASDPFGVFQPYARIEARGEAIVYPRPLPLEGDLGRTGVQTRGMSTGERTRATESGLDFYGIRDYQPGDELRRIHWPATAHHGRLTVIEFDRGASENLGVALDARAGTEFGTGAYTSFELAVRAAASLIHWVVNSEGAAFLAADSAEGPRWLAVDRPDREYEMLEVLARAKADGSMPASALLEWAGGPLGAGQNIVLITAAPDAGLPGAISALRQRQVGVATVVVDAQSFDPSAGRPLETIELLEAAGALTVCVSRGDNLREVLEGVLIVVD